MRVFLDVQYPGMPLEAELTAPGKPGRWGGKAWLCVGESRSRFCDGAELSMGGVRS
jgi:hypothetical protein